MPPAPVPPTAAPLIVELYLRLEAPARFLVEGADVSFVPTCFFGVTSASPPIREGTLVEEPNRLFERLTVLVVP